MKTILYFRASEGLFSRKLSGIFDVARERDWDVRLIPACRTAAAAREFVRQWRADGCIVNCGPGSNDFSSAAFGDLPVVYADRPAHQLKDSDSCVYHDSVATAVLATRELLSLDLPRHLYIGYAGPRAWDLERERTFRRELGTRGKGCAVLRLSHQQIARCEVRELAQRLRSLAGGAGVFAATDILSELVVEACRFARLSVPEDVAVIGVDNDLNTCEYSIPTLSSVEPDYCLAGRKSAEALARLMDGETAAIRETYGPLRLVRRESTRRLGVMDHDVFEAIEFIRRNACTGLSVADVAARFACSRRMTELRFRKATGHTLSDEIRERRLEKARELLVRPHAKIAAVADFCGYRSASAFIHVFTKATGLSPTRWATESAAPRLRSCPAARDSGTGRTSVAHHARSEGKTPSL